MTHLSEMESESDLSEVPIVNFHLVVTHNVQDDTKTSVLGCLGMAGNVALSTSGSTRSRYKK